YPLYRLDNLRIISQNKEDGLVVEKLYEAQQEVSFSTSKQVEITTNKSFNTNDQVYIVKTRRYEQIIKDKLKPFINKIEIKIRLSLGLEKPAQVFILNQEYLIPIKSAIALKLPLNESNIKDVLEKNNNSPFILNVDKISLEANLFINTLELKRLHKEIIAILIKQRLAYQCSSLITYEKKVHTFKPKNKKKRYVIKTKQQALALQMVGIKEVYLSNLLIIDDLKSMFDLIIPILPRIIKDDYFDYYLDIALTFSRVMVSELGMLKALQNYDIEIETNFSFNIINNEGLDFLSQYQVNNVLVGIESNDYLDHPSLSISKIGYGRLPLMIMDYCPINLNKQDLCLDCNLCQNKQYYLKDEKASKMPLIYSNDSILELYSAKAITLKSGAVNYDFIYYNFTIETYDETINILKNK
ncbi:MAG: DUF3656 domain-containing protein, partial [Bacilli bacterium]